MADDTQKTLEEIEKVTADLSRNFSKIKKEITDSGKETNVWLDATKELQTAQSNVKSSTQTIRDLGKQYVSNLKERNRLHNEELPALDKARRLLDTRKTQNDALIASTQALLASSSAGSIEAINAQQKLNELTSIGLSIDEDITKNKERQAGIKSDVIPALEAAATKLRDQAKAAANIRREEKARKEIAEKMVTINENLMQPLIGDAQEFSKAMKFADAMGKNINNTFNQFFLVVGASLGRFKELDKAAGDFREKTGFIVTQTRQLDKAAREVNVQFAALGISIGSVYATIQALTDQFQVVGLVTKEMISDTAQMAANIGIAITDAAKFRGLFTSISKSAGMTATQSMQAATALAEMGGVAPSAVIKDMAEASGETLSFLAKSPMALIKATVEARRLGTTVNSLSKSARGFLNYQDSITSELEASALIGKSLNFQEARAAAYAGDVVKSRELALKQLEKAGDFTKLNVYQQEALAKAAGMTVDEVIKQQNQQKMLAEFRAKATGKDKEMLDKYEAMQRKIAENEKAAKEDLVARGREMMQQQLRQAEMNKLTNALNAIWTDITDALLPISNAIMPPIIVSVRLIGGLFKVIGALIRGFLKPFDVFTKTLRSGEDNSQRLEEFLTKVGEVIEEYIIPSVETFGEILGNVFKVFGFIATLTGKLVTEFKPFTATLDAVGKAVVWIGSTFGKIFPSIVNIGKAILTFITAPLNKILPIIQNVFAVFSKLTGAISGGTSIFSPVLKVFSGIGKFIGVFGKGIPVIGQAISVLQVLWELGKSLFSIWSDDNLSFGDKIIASFKAVPAAIFDALIAPFIDIGAWILKKFGVDIPDDAIESFKNLAKQIFVTLMSPISTLFTIISAMSGGIGSKIWEGIKSVGGAIFSVLAWPFRKISEFVYGIFTPSGGGGIISAIMNGISAAGSFILDVLLFPFKFVVGMVSDLFSGNGELGTKIIEGIKSVASFIFDILSFPFKTVINFVSGLFGGNGDLGTKILDGIKSIGSFILDILTLPFKNVVNFVSTLFSNAGEFATSIISGIKSIAGTLFDIFTVPFREVVNFVSGLFGGSGELGTKIIEGIKTTVAGIFDIFVKAFSTLIDVITWPFKQAFELISKIPFISKLFGGGNADATANVSGDAKAKVESSTTAPMEVKGLTELKDAIVKLTDAITRIGENRSTATTTATDASGGVCCDAVVGKLDQLITLMTEGNIGVNIDGVKASKLLARASV